MPVYEYKCESCANTVEVFARLYDPEVKQLPRCPKCGGKMERKFSPFNNHFTPTRGKNAKSDT